VRFNNHVLTDELSKVVFLGESLTALTAIYKGHIKPHVIIDVWEGGSSLYGWDFAGKCIDRLPILTRSKCYILNDEKYVQVKPIVEVVGSEDGFTDKITSRIPDTIQINWLDTMSEGGYMLLNGWCSMLRKLKSKVVNVSKIYGEIKYIHLDRSVIKVGWRKEIRYAKIVNTLPLPYFTSKIITMDNNVKRVSDMELGLSYVSLYIMTLIASKSDISLEKSKVIKVGKKGFLTALIFMLPMNYVYGLNDLVLIYVLSPITLDTLKPELSSKILSELRRLNVLTNFKSIYFYRDHFERYAILGESRGKINDFMNTLRGYGIEFMGRLGSWKDVWICDVLEN